VSAQVKQLILLACCLLLASCAALPALQEITPQENSEVRRRFKEMVALQAECRCCLDGTAHISLKNVVYSGAVSGFLQAMSPSFLKFVGVNPLGQPLAIFTADGSIFRYVSIPEGTVYTGQMDSETFVKYTPEGFIPTLSYYWLIGRLQPGPVQLTRVSRDETMAYWVELDYENGKKALVLFDPDALQIRRHIVFNSAGERILNIHYDGYGPEKCDVPRHIIVTSLRLDSTMEIRLDNLRDEASLSRKDFDYVPPDSFDEVVVE